ncbi:AMP nucleosidase [Asaia bogorensis]|uniref:AMP nucleosidase n=1 Tax=Asaia bogorensis NBRC 16594 TaxID=1231624 RepID=A0AAN4R0E9_9PROT|nr:AMP nucleosidase [Asaia bogorensis]BAT20104.1 AMP nucleosidase [Asaia bogorensis NBRC 16594]GBQ80417.1 AMP nucleosidase [Asaia bogorensis NBRC 16594]GEL52476.1 AMP nucleosidase [Asaia bogorensis NBRC 16594]
MSVSDQDGMFDQVGSGFMPFHDAEAALDRIEALYDEGASRLRKAFEAREPAESYYPYLAFSLARGSIPHDVKPRFGVLLEPGFYGTTLTRPALFRSYWRAQIENLLECYRQPVHVGLSRRPMPLPYVMEEAVTGLTESDLKILQDNYALPDLHATDDRIANCEIIPDPDAPRALALFTAERTDYSLARLHHYTGTAPRHFQRFILLTNYQRYVDGFRDYARAQVDAGGEYSAFVEPGDAIYSKTGMSGQPSASLPQMPAYHLCRPDGDGITLINIGVGPSNAKTITDHLAVLRPHCWLMVGHCAGLRRTQLLGDYVLAHGYVRDDHVLDDDLPTWVPVPPIAEVQVALQEAMERVTGLDEREIKTRLRTGTVMTTDNRNWELRLRALFTQINMSRSIAVDMESATIAANGFRFRVPYGTLLCVSDKPLHGELKLRGMANAFYRERVSQHLMVGIETMRLLRERGVESLHSRKLRGFDEPAFR